MSEIASIAAGLSSIRTAIDIAKAIKDADKAWEVAEFKLKMVDLIDKLVESKSSLIEIKEQNEELRGKLEKALKQAEKNASMHFDGCIYIDKNEPEPHNIYCATCWDVDTRAVRLQYHGDGGGYECKSCKSHFYRNDYNR